MLVLIKRKKFKGKGLQHILHVCPLVDLTTYHLRTLRKARDLCLRRALVRLS